MRTEGNGCNNVVAGLVNEMVDKTEKVSTNAKREEREAANVMIYLRCMCEGILNCQGAFETDGQQINI
jgi:hypothetical protein